MTRPLVTVWRSPRWLVSAALLWLGCTAIYFLTAPGRIDMFDGGIRHDVTESLIEIGTAAVRDPWFPGVPGRGGLRYAWYELGASIAAIPLVTLGGALGHGSLESKQFAFSFTSVPFASATVALLFLIYGRLGCSLPRALTWSLVAAFCTLLWPYAGSSFDAALQALWLTLAVWALIEGLATRSLAWAGLSGAAFAMLINVQEAYVVLAPSALAVFPISFRAVRERLRDPVVKVFAVGVGAGIGLVFAANAWRYGNPLETGRALTGGHPVAGNPIVGLAGLFVSPAKSIFLYSPPYALGLVGLYRLFKSSTRQLAPVLAPIVACLFLHLALISSLRFWAGEWAWGPRYLVATLPLVSIGLPFAGRPGEAPEQSDKRAPKLLVCALGLVVQLLAISVDHQRYYFERSLPPFFWTDQSMMYKDSPVLARPFELLAVLKRRDVDRAHALVPVPRPMSMTSSIFGPPPDLLPQSPEWMREYLVFLVPRPWPLWSRVLPGAQRPGPTRLMAAIGCLVAAGSFGILLSIVLQSARLNRTSGSPSLELQKAQEKAG